MSLHVVPGSIFRRKDSIKMRDQVSDPKMVIEEMKSFEAVRVDKDGNAVTVKIY